MQLFIFSRIIQKLKCDYFFINGTTNAESEGAPFILIWYDDLCGLEEAEEVEYDYFSLKGKTNLESDGAPAPFIIIRYDDLGG